MNYNCPNCNSENTQKLEIAHQSGKSNISGTSSNIGVGMSSGGLGVGVSSGNFSGSQQSLLSQSVTPPEKHVSVKMGCGFILLVITLFVCLGQGIENSEQATLFIFLLFISIGLIYWGRVDSREKNKVYEKNIRIYNEKFICLRCGNIFIPE